jgi:hypothetical protein
MSSSLKKENKLVWIQDVIPDPELVGHDEDGKPHLVIYFIQSWVHAVQYLFYVCEADEDKIDDACEHVRKTCYEASNFLSSKGMRPVKQEYEKQMNFIIILFSELKLVKRLLWAKGFEHETRWEFMLHAAKQYDNDLKEFKSVMGRLNVALLDHEVETPTEEIMKKLQDKMVQVATHHFTNKKEEHLEEEEEEKSYPADMDSENNNTFPAGLSQDIHNMMKLLEKEMESNMETPESIDADMDSENEHTFPAGLSQDIHNMMKLLEIKEMESNVETPESIERSKAIQQRMITISES